MAAYGPRIAGRLFRLKRPPQKWRGPRPTRRSNPSWLPLVLLIAMAVGARYVYQQPNGVVPGDDGRELAGPVRVGDGDSIDIGDARIRLHGIDAVELAQLCKDARGMDYACGEDAKRALEMLVRNRVVRCDERHGVDQYGRITAVCTADGIDLNAAMVDAGFALAYRQHSLTYVPNEDRARAAKVGIWAGSFQNPWDYRRE
jgi:endonuclease YncB( thermonuclease family)